MTFTHIHKPLNNSKPSLTSFQFGGQMLPLILYPESRNRPLLSCCHDPLRATLRPHYTSHAFLVYEHFIVSSQIPLPANYWIRIALFSSVLANHTCCFNGQRPLDVPRYCRRIAFPPRRQTAHGIFRCRPFPYLCSFVLFCRAALPAAPTRPVLLKGSRYSFYRWEHLHPSWRELSNLSPSDSEPLAPAKYPQMVFDRFGNPPVPSNERMPRLLFSPGLSSSVYAGVFSCPNKPCPLPAPSCPLSFD